MSKSVHPPFELNQTILIQRPSSFSALANQKPGILVQTLAQEDFE